MTTAARLTEAERATVAYQLALSKVGVSTIADALALWQTVPATEKAPTSEHWLAQAIELVMTRRSLSRDLARAYYRLVRALITGKTVPDPFHPDPTSVTLAELRRQFRKLQDETNGHHTDGSAPPQEGDDDLIGIESVGDVQAASEHGDREAEKEAETVLTALGPDNLSDKLGAIDDSLSASVVDGQRSDAHLQAGARQAAAAARVAMNGGRSEIWTYLHLDKRVLGWARYSTTGTPCGWCAMLISRGPVYRSAESAQFSDGDLYHDNCHCSAIPVFSQEQYDKSAAFDLNRQYHEEWPRVTKGLSGKAAVSAWRRYIRTQQRRPAQAAA